MTETVLPKHAKFGASKAGLWMNCDGAVAMAAIAPPQLPSPYAEKGTRAHALAEYCLRNDLDTDAYVADPKAHRFEDAPWPDELDETARGVQVYLDTIRSTLSTDPDAKLFIEQKVELSSTFHDVAYGTLDCGIFMPTRRRLGVIDYKNGTGVVDVEQNKQLLCYAGGLLKHVDQTKIDDIEIVIVQPNARYGDTVKRYVVTLAELRAFSTEVNAAIERGLASDQVLKAGPWCDEGYCTARGMCPEYAEYSMAGAQEISPMLDVSVMTQGIVPNVMDVLPQPELLTPEQIAKVLDLSEGIKAWLSQVESVAFGLALSGTSIPNRKLVAKDARRKWSADEQVIVDYLVLLYGLDIDTVMPRKLATITTIEALVKQTLPLPKLRKEAIDALTLAFMSKESSGLTLVHESNRREAATMIETAVMLAGIETIAVD